LISEKMGTGGEELPGRPARFGDRFDQNSPMQSL
jgi:hypothetical protein